LWKIRGQFARYLEKSASGWCELIFSARSVSSHSPSHCFPIGQANWPTKYVRRNAAGDMTRDAPGC